MRYLIFLILACEPLLPSLSLAYDVLVVQSRRDPAYDEVLKGFRAQRHLSERIIVLSDYADTDIVRIVREDNPGLVLTLGDSALTAARKLRQTPVLALMSLGIHKQKGSDNICGIGMFASAERYMGIFKAMKVNRVGVLHNPAKSGWYLQEARHAAQIADIELVIREVREPRDTLAQLASLAGKVNGLWMLPDTTTVTRETSEAYFRFAQEQSLPLASFAVAYLGMGAAAVVEIDLVQLGRQANDMAVMMLHGGSDRYVVKPGKTSVKANLSVLKHLGISSVNFEASSNYFSE